MKNAIILIGVSFFIFGGLNFAQQGYIVAGETQSYTHGTAGVDKDFLIYKIDIWGRVQWRKNLGGDEEDIAYSIQQTTDGGYVVAGSTGSFTHHIYGDFLIYKLNAEGNKQWRKNLGGMIWQEARSIRQTSDGGYVVAGTTLSYSHGAQDILVYKLDGSGRKQWRKNFGGISEEISLSIRQTADGGYVVAGGTGSYTHGSADFLVYKLDATGGKQWRRNMGGIDFDLACDIQQTTDGGYVAAGYTGSYTHGSGDTDCLIYKLDASGRKQWRKNLGGTENDSAFSIQQTTDGGYVVAGSTSSYTNGLTDFLIYKLNADGNKLWRNNLGGTNSDYGHSIQQTSDGGYVVAGTTNSYTNGGKDFLIFKLDPTGSPIWGGLSYIHLGGIHDDAAHSIQETMD